jgi:hypothetical protein
MLVSIIISSFNYGRFLRAAIDSALAQSYPHTEVIVVDDGSTDDSREIIASYGGHVIPILKENGGQASAFNAGFAASRGEAVCFLDSDDVLLPTALEMAVPLFLGGAVVKVHWPLWGVDEGGVRNGRLFPAQPLPEGDLRETLLRCGPVDYNWPPTSGNAWTRQFLARVLPIPEVEYRVSPDFYLSALAPFFGRIGRVAEPQALWRMHGSNNSGRGAFDEWLRGELRRWEHCCGVLGNHSRELGLRLDLETWRKNSWLPRLRQTAEEIAALIPAGASFILVDEEQWRVGGAVTGRRAIPFIERAGQYWGPPADDEAAVGELERLRQAGANFIVFGWPAFWWLDYYAGFNRHLRQHFRPVLENDRAIVFDLRPPAR